VVVLLNERPHLQPATDELLGEEGVAFALGVQELTDERTDGATQVASSKASISSAESGLTATVVSTRRRFSSMTVRSRAGFRLISPSR